MILEIVNREMAAIGINYHLMMATNPVYPYFTCEPSENDFSFEENKTQGQLLIEGWTRGTWSELFAAKDIIKQHFADYRTVENGEAVYINYLSSLPIRSGEAELKKIQIILEFKTWELDENI